MNTIYKNIGIYKEGGPIETVECTECGAMNEMPLYVNVGRFTPATLWCWNCFTSFKYWKYYGCQTVSQCKSWNSKKYTNKRTKGKMIEKE